MYKATATIFAFWTLTVAALLMGHGLIKWVML